MYHSFRSPAAILLALAVIAGLTPPTRACSMAPGFHVRTGPGVVHYWHAGGPLVDLTLVDSDGEPVPAHVQTTTVPAAVLGDNLIPLYRVSRHYTTLTPAMPLEPGRYKVEGVSRGGSTMEVPFDQATTPPSSPRHLSADVVIEEAYVSYDSACNPIYEPEQFVEASFDAEQIDATPTSQSVYEVTWVPVVDGAVDRDRARTTRGLLAEADDEGRSRIRIPYWWFDGIRKNDDQIRLALRAVSDAGIRSDAAWTSFKPVESVSREPSEVLTPIDARLARSLPHFQRVAGSPDAQRVFQMLSSTSDPQGELWFDTYFENTVLSRDQRVLMKAKRPDTDIPVGIQVPIDIQGGLASPGRPIQRGRVGLFKVVCAKEPGVKGPRGK